MKSSALNPKLSPAGVIAVTIFIVAVAWATVAANRQPTPAEVRAAELDAAAADVQRALQRAEYEIGRERLMASVRMYCRNVPAAECRDMRIAAGLDTPD